MEAYFKIQNVMRNKFWNKIYIVLGKTKQFLPRIISSYEEISPQRTRKCFLSSHKFAQFYETGMDGVTAYKKWLMLESPTGDMLELLRGMRRKKKEDITPVIDRTHFKHKKIIWKLHVTIYFVILNQTSLRGQGFRSLPFLYRPLFGKFTNNKNTYIVFIFQLILIL